MFLTRDHEVLTMNLLQITMGAAWEQYNHQFQMNLIVSRIAENDRIY